MIVFRKLRSASRLSPSGWLDFIQAWWWLLFFDLGLRTCPFPALQALAARVGFHSAPAPGQTELIIRGLKEAVERARRNHFYPMTCLRRALALQKMLALRGVAAELKLGVRKEAGQFSAHAWLEYLGQPLGEPEQITEQYATLRKASHSER